MPDKPTTTGVPFEGSDAHEQQLWSALEQLPRPMPSAHLRQKFYTAAARPSFGERLRGWFGFASPAGWVTAAACLVIGVALGPILRPAGNADTPQLAALEQQVAMLNRSLILDRLQNNSATARLQGVIDAGAVAVSDPTVARALLTRATEDRSASVRAAAIDALGPQLQTPEVGDELMALLEGAESPLVQLALVDLVLRHGSVDQLEQLLMLAEANRLHPDLINHVKNSIKRNQA